MCWLMRRLLRSYRSSGRAIQPHKILLFFVLHLSAWPSSSRCGPRKLLDGSPRCVESGPLGSRGRMDDAADGYRVAPFGIPITRRVSSLQIRNSSLPTWAACSQEPGPVAVGNYAAVDGSSYEHIRVAGSSRADNSGDGHANSRDALSPSNLSPTRIDLVLPESGR